MLRTRILAAATAALLMLGMSVGGATAANAVPNNNNGSQKVFVCKYVGTPGVDERPQTGNNPISVSVNSIPDYQGVGSYFADAQGRSFVLGEDNRQGGGQTGEPDVSECPAAQSGVATASISALPATCDLPTRWNLAGASIDKATWGEPSLSGSVLTIVATASVGALFAAGPGVSDDRTTKTFTVSYSPAGGGECGPPLAVAAVTISERTCFTATSLVADLGASSNVSWNEPEVIDGMIVIVATATGGALFDEELSGVSDDRTQRTFSTAFEEAGGPDCVLPSIDVTASMTNLNCDPGTGSFTAGLVDAEDENADKLLWTTSTGTVPSAVANTVNGPTTVTITVRLADAHVGGSFALNDSSGLGVVSVVTVDGVETALITWTFDFTTPENCPSLAGSTASSQCEADAPYLEWSIDLTDSEGAVSLPATATLTLRSTTNPALTYEFPAVMITSTGVTTGSALWPGAAVDGDGNGTAWPGWAFVGGEWVVDDSNYGWVRGADVELLIEVNPEIEIPVSYPNATPDCANPPVTVPAITEVDECVGEGDNQVQTATFTVTRAANLSYTYTVNGGDEIAIVFPDGEDTVTVAVAALDTVEVTAIPADGFRLDGSAIWSHMFIGAALCLSTNPTTEASAEIIAPDCLGNPGQIILTNGLGVIWTLNGEVVAGNTTHTRPAGTAITLVASLEGPSDEYPGGFGWNDAEQRTEWNAVMEVDPEAGGEECLLDEEELAFTGSGALTTWLGVFAVIAMIVGMGFVIRRHQLV